MNQHGHAATRATRRAQDLTATCGLASRSLAMSHPGRATNEAANNEWREVLATIKEEILALVANKKDGVTADECSSVRTLGWTLADPLRGLTKTPISPGYSGPLAEARCEDELTKRLLCGAQVWDGGNRGVPLQTRKVGACFCDALALGVFGGGLEAADDAWQYSLPIRVAIVRTALRHMPQFLNLEYYTTLHAYDAAVLDEVTTIGCPVTPVLPPMVARVFYLLGVAEMASEFATCQQAAVPWASEALRVKIRPFHPGNSVEVEDGWACVGGQWSKQEFPPLSMTNMGRDALDALPTLHLSMTLSSWEGKPFSNIKEFGIVCREEDTQRLNMPEFGHWVFLLAPENFGALGKEEVQALAEVRALEVEEERLRAVDVLAGRQAQGCAVDETCAHPVEIGGLESAQLAAETEALRREQTSADVVVEEPMAERLVQTTQTSQERQVLSATASMVLLLLSPSMVPVVCLVVCLVVQGERTMTTATTNCPTRATQTRPTPNLRRTNRWMQTSSRGVSALDLTKTMPANMQKTWLVKKQGRDKKGACGVSSVVISRDALLCCVRVQKRCSRKETLDLTTPAGVTLRAQGYAGGGRSLTSGLTSGRKLSFVGSSRSCTWMCAMHRPGYRPKQSCRNK